MRTIDKQWSYKNGVYELRVEITQESLGGYSLDVKRKHVIAKQVFHGITKQECLNKLQTYKYNDTHGFTKGIEVGLLKLI